MPSSPRYIAQFQLLQPLGQGAMGLVYRALDTQLKRQVALKLLPENVAHDPARRARFLREARAAASISHPNIATIYQVGETASDVFIAMELVVGRTLEDWLSCGRLTLEQTYRVALDLCNAVGAAHQAGVVHRDLKPANIMFAESGQLKVLDFGIAKLQASAFQEPALSSGLGNSGTQLMQAVGTQHGQVLGTPGYMSPEQAHAGLVDTRSDVFSIGVIIYELVTGQRPFGGSSMLEVINSTTHEDPAPPTTLNPEVSPELAELLRACLHKDPNFRPHDALRLSALLEQQFARLGSAPKLGQAQPRAPLQPASYALEAPTTSAGVAGSIQQIPSKSSKSTLWLLVAGAAAFAVALLVAGTLAVGHYQGWFGGQLRQPELGLRTLSKYEHPNDSSASSLAPPAWAAAARDFEAAAGQPRAPERWLAAAAFARGQEAFGKGQLEAARAAFELSKQRDDEFALPWIGLSNVHLRKKQFKEAIDAAQQAQVLAPRLWPAVTASARAYVHKGQLDFAIQEYRRALELAGEQPYLLSELALTYHAAHMDQDAERYAQRALELDPDLVPALILLAERALENANGKLAVEYSQRATGVEPRDVTGWLALGDGYILLDEPDLALNAWRTALRLWRETRQRGAPESRLAEVQSALDNDKLPAPRGGASGSDSGPATPAAEQATVARTEPAARSQPAARSKPQPRSKPASAPSPRSRPDAKKASERSTPSPLDGLDQ